MIPKITYEERIWTPSFDLSSYDIWQRIQIEKPYRAAVPAFIADAEVTVSNDIRDLYDAAIETIVRFDTELTQKSIVMPQILLRSESASSSQIEHLSASARNVALAELGETLKTNADLVAANIRAMQKALDQRAPITKDALLQIHKALLEKADPEIAGVFRTQQVWIGGRSVSPHDADFVPPHHEKIRAYIDDWLSFAGRSDIHILIKAAIAHCQFETIHPFLDGNGRTGRALIQIMLHEAGLIRKSALPISAGLLADINSYFAALTEYRNGNYDPMVSLFCKAALDAVEVGMQTVRRFEELKDAWNEKIKARRDAAVWRLADLLLVHPVIDAKYVSAKLSITDPAARNAIEHLMKIGILRKLPERFRNVLYEAAGVTSLTDRFAAEIGRRS